MSLTDRRAERARRDPPTVVLRHAGLPGHVVRELCAGLEEEGVPVRIDGNTDESGGEPGLVALAFAAARSSPLDVGIGVDESGVCVHHAKRRDASPVLITEHDRARWCGHNAARLVVGLPFKQRPEHTETRSGEPHQEES